MHIAVVDESRHYGHLIETLLSSESVKCSCSDKLAWLGTEAVNKPVNLYIFVLPDSDAESQIQLRQLSNGQKDGTLPSAPVIIISSRKKCLEDEVPDESVASICESADIELLGELGKPFPVQDLLSLVQKNTQSLLSSNGLHTTIKSATRERSGSSPALSPSDMITAIGRGELQAFYQPVYSLGTQQLKCFEALVRWRHPKAGVLGPMNFDSLLTHKQTAWPLTQIILHQVFAWASHPLNQKLKFVFSVNLPLPVLTKPGFVHEVAAMTKFMGVSPQCIGFEFSQHDGLLSELEKVLQLRHQGFCCILDGFHSMNVLPPKLNGRLFQQVKLSPTLTCNVESDSVQSCIRQLMETSAPEGIQVIAVGVESQSQKSRLIDLGCQWAQGNLFCPPASVDEFKHLLLHESEMRFGV